MSATPTIDSVRKLLFAMRQANGVLPKRLMMGEETFKAFTQEARASFQMFPDDLSGDGREGSFFMGIPIYVEGQLVPPDMPKDFHS